jgi:hypothetical protein
MRTCKWLGIIGLATFFLTFEYAQIGRGRPPVREQLLAPTEGLPGEFVFVRAIYNSPFRGRRWGWGSWATDFPEADVHFLAGIARWSGSRLRMDAQPRQVSFLDPLLYEFPLIYIVEPGYMEISEEEAMRLREYLLRGGFLFLDDFWGDYEWENVATQLQKVLPNRDIADLPLDHPLFHSFFDIDEVVQVPGIGAWLGRGLTYEKGGVVPHYMGIQDEQGRLMVFIARNCDLGDAWEWIDNSRYPLKYGLAAYRLATNVLVYAMSH